MQIHSQQSLMRVHGLAPYRGPRLAESVRAACIRAWRLPGAVLRREAAYRTELRRLDHLAALPDRLLHDIGLTRDAVRRARHKFTRSHLRDYWT